MNFDIVFSVGDCNNIKYYMPIVQHAKLRNLSYAFDLNYGWNKYCSVDIPKNKKWTLGLMEKNNIPKFDRSKDTASVRICNEGRHNPADEKNTKLYSLTSLVDYTFSYFKYIDKIDYCVLPSNYFLNFFKKEEHMLLGTGGNDTKKQIKKTIKSMEINSHKNLVLGSTKYDCLETFNKDRIYKKYNLKKNEKYALFMYPRVTDLSKTKYKDVIEDYKKKGYKIIAKTRAKDPFQNTNTDIIDFYFYDQWYWPSTSLELISISDIVINTDSCTVKEAVMLEKKIVNIKSKNYNVLTALYEKDAKRKYLWTHNASNKLLDHIEKHLQ